jgi:hypothetical protein
VGKFFNGDWQRRYEEWSANPPTLARVYHWLRGYENFGSFVAGQMIAALKHDAAFRNAPDWMTFAAPGNGSMRGVNLYYGLPIDSPWKSEDAWRSALLRMRDQVMPRMMAAGVSELDAHDTQNVACEASKVYRLVHAGGKLKKGYAPPADRTLVGEALADPMIELSRDRRTRLAAAGLPNIDGDIGDLPPRDLIVAFASERESIRRRKEAGEPFPWSDDRILSTAGSFTNVNRESDRTTRWYAANVRDIYAGTSLVLPATVLFLWFNSIRTGATLFTRGPDGSSPFDRAMGLLREGIRPQAAAE